MPKGGQTIRQLCILLGCIIAFDFAIFWMIVINAEAEFAQVLKQADSRRTIATTNDLLESLYHAGDSISKYVFVEPSQQWASQYNRSLELIQIELSEIKSLVKTNPDGEQARVIQAIDADVQKGVGILKDLKRVCDQNQNTADRILTVKYGLRKQAQMQDLLVRLVKNTSTFIALQKRLGQEAEERRVSQRVITYSAIAIAVLGNILLLWLFMQRFGKYARERLEQIVHRLQSISDHEGWSTNAIETSQTHPDIIETLEKELIDLQKNLQTEKDLLAQNQRTFEQIIQSIPVGIIVLDKNKKESGSVAQVNPEMHKILPDGDIRATHEIVAAVRRHKNQDPSYKKEHRIAVRNRHYEVVSRENGLLLVQDVTSQVKLEQLKRSFVAMVSHDLRTPLTAVGGFLELLPTGMYGQASKESLDETKLRERDLDGLISLINDVLEIEKLQLDKSHWQAIDLKTITGQILTQTIQELDLGDRIDFALEIGQDQITIIKVETEKYRLARLLKAILSIFASICEPQQDISILCLRSATHLHIDFSTVLAKQRAKDMIQVIQRGGAFSRLLDKNLGLALPLMAALLRYLEARLDWLSTEDRLQARLSLLLADR